jgi:hypothetical protein
MALMASFDRHSRRKSFARLDRRTGSNPVLIAGGGAIFLAAVTSVAFTIELP